MKKRVIGAILGVACVGWVVGCSEPNQDVQTDLAKIPLAPGVSDQPVQKPFKSRAKKSSPPLSESAPK